MMLRRTLTFAALGFAVAGGAQAQTASENRDADALAADMRILAANPLDIEALITAGELTLRMGDSTAAATFFGRAEKLDPNNPRIKAGWGSLMVRAERPGMALVRFQEAERRGLNPSKFAADRGLAYDLIGEQDRAQRDYRLALRDGADDEVTRRYALSLGISGKKDDGAQAARSAAPAQRPRGVARPRVHPGDERRHGRRREDRRDDDVAGARRGADAVLPQAAANCPPPIARSRSISARCGRAPNGSPTRRLVPPLPRLGPDPYAPKVVVGRAAGRRCASVDDGRKRKKRKKDEHGPPPRRRSSPSRSRSRLAPPVYVPPRVDAGARRLRLHRCRRRSASRPSPPPTRPVPAPAPAPTPAPRAVAAADTCADAGTVDRAGTRRPSRRARHRRAATPAPNPAPTAPIEVAANHAVAPPVDPVPGTADQPSAAEAGVPEPTATARVSEDTVLARIVAGLDKPPPAPRRNRAARRSRPRRRLPRSRPSRSRTPSPPTTRTRGKPAQGRARRRQDSDRPRPRTRSPTLATRRAGRSRPKDDDEPALDKNGCPIPPKPAKGKAAAPAKPRTPMTAREKANDARCKTATAKAKADAETKGEPARVWVQVAGGANEGDLRKAWAALQAKAPDLFRGRQGWSTPLRATNRVLTGPFKSSDEAQAFVNRMGKAGLSGFVFTSAKGQKIDRLGAK